MKHLVFVILLLVFSSGCSEEQQLPRGFDEERIAQLNQLDRYNYDQVIEPASNPVLEFLIRVIGVIANLLNSYLGYIVLIVIILLLAWILYKTIKIPEADGSSDRVESFIQHQTEDIEVMDYNKLFLEAINRNDYRLAIRYLYLGSLKQLHQAQFIEWKKDKTNYEYLGELPKYKQMDFRSLYSIYEYVWYGEFQADNQQVDKMNQLKKRIED